MRKGRIVLEDVGLLSFSLLLSFLGFGFYRFKSLSAGQSFIHSFGFACIPTFIHSFIHDLSFLHSFIHSFIHLLISLLA